MNGRDGKSYLKSKTQHPNFVGYKKMGRLALSRFNLNRESHLIVTAAGFS
jgi:hypothetical protein